MSENNKLRFGWRHKQPGGFLGMHYYKLLPIDQLKNLAACMVVAGGTLNSGAIDGLEMMFCTKHGCQSMPPESVRDLHAEASAKLARIGEMVLKGSMGQ